MIFALTGPETWNMHAVRSGERILAGLVAPSGLIRVGEFPRVNPGLCYFGHFGPQTGRMTDEVKILRRDLL
jgi:hypothetical protein